MEINRKTARLVEAGAIVFTVAGQGALAELTSQSLVPVKEHGPFSSRRKEPFRWQAACRLLGPQQRRAGFAA
jgi:hypothetical protein